MAREEEDIAAEFDPEFDSLLANMLSYVSLPYFNHIG
jgi:hypothetical protein